jgi:hypothetical protein
MSNQERVIKRKASGLKRNDLMFDYWIILLLDYWITELLDCLIKCQKKKSD